MTAPENRILRLTYEAFSRLSTSLYTCNDYKEVADCLHTHLKYLFNYLFFRAYCELGERTFILSSGQADWEIQGGANCAPLEHERKLMETGIPLFTDFRNEPGSGKHLPLLKAERGKLWAWSFCSSERRLILSIFTEDENSFTTREVIFVRLIADILGSKMLELSLIRKLDTSNAKLQKALHIISEKNREINDIVTRQRDIILQRTRELSKKNEKLLDLSSLNAHALREPLTRILGLLELSEQMTPEEFTKELIPRLKESASDMDKALRKVISQTLRD